MNTDRVYISTDRTRKRQVSSSGICRFTISCIKLVVYLSIVAGICWLLSQLITKEVVIAIGLILGFLITGSVLKFALSVIFIIIKWIVITVAVIVLLSVI